MNSVNKTLYIPLYGKAYVSKKHIIIDDKKAEYIWDKEGFSLKGKSKSKWLAYFLGMRTAVFDKWLQEKLSQTKNITVLHIGCGMDSRALRVDCDGCQWYDVDFADVIEERKKYYEETKTYHMLAADARKTEWLNFVTGETAIAVLEGISMYFTVNEMQALLKAITDRFKTVYVLMDCYTLRAAKATKYKNPINDVGVTQVYGIDEPKIFENNTGLVFKAEHSLTPPNLIEQLNGFEKAVFKRFFAGKISRAMYRLYEYTCE